MFPIVSRIITGVDPIKRFAALISNCIAAKNLYLGEHIHCYLIKTSLVSNTYLSNRLIDFYSKCRSIKSAQKVFHDLHGKNTFSWNTMISCSLQNGLLNEALQLFKEIPEPNIVSYNSMISGLTSLGLYEESVYFFRSLQFKSLDSIMVDEFTLASMVGCCAHLGELRLLCQLHGMAVMVGLEANVIISNSLIDVYGKFGRPDFSYAVFTHMVERDVVSWTSMVVAFARSSFMDDAYSVFSQMPDKNTISWTALIAGFAQNGQGNVTLNLFYQMQIEGIRPNVFTYVSLLGACADLPLAEKGKELHGHLIRYGIMGNLSNIYLCNGLINMYCKTGDMSSATVLFEKLSSKDVVSWNSIITGYAQNGEGERSLEIFQRMIQANVKPNHVTFLSVLSACSHRGLVKEGMQILSSMGEFGLHPRSDHYAIMIDLLGRVNRLDEAVNLSKRAPEGSDHVGIWGAILGACRLHGHMELATRAAETLFSLEPENAGRYVMLSNIYASAKRWEDANRVRRLMDDRGLNKDAAFSCIEVKNSRHVFVAKDKSHSQREEIYEVLNGLMSQMKDSRCLLLHQELWLGALDNDPTVDIETRQSTCSLVGSII